MKQETAEVLANEHLGSRYYRVGLRCSDAFLKATPGQFVMVHPIDTKAPLLSRPFSIHRLVPGEKGTGGIELLYKVVGDCTRIISRLQPGNHLDLLGPLGRGFDISGEHRLIYLVSGGIGVAPMVFLATSLLAAGIAAERCKVFLGGMTGGDLLCRQDFSDLGLETCISTDDGSMGESGVVTDSVRTAMESAKPDMIYACGPMAMLGSVSAIAESCSVPCQVSVEAIMACGVGACLGCAVESRGNEDAYHHACVDGPVFDSAVLVYR